MPIKPAGVGVKHGTFGFFSESVGLKGFIRSDFKDFNDHASTGRYVAADAGAIGFMPIGDGRSMEGQVRAIGLDLGAGAVTPGSDEVLAGKYDKLSRTVYLYINSNMLAKGSAQDVEFAKLLVRDLEKFRAVCQSDTAARLAVPREHPSSVVRALKLGFTRLCRQATLHCRPPLRC